MFRLFGQFIQTFKAVYSVINECARGACTCFKEDGLVSLVSINHQVFVSISGKGSFGPRFVGSYGLAPHEIDLASAGMAE